MELIKWIVIVIVSILIEWWAIDNLHKTPMHFITACIGCGGWMVGMLFIAHVLGWR